MQSPEAMPSWLSNRHKEKGRDHAGVLRGLAGAGTGQLRGEVAFVEALEGLD